MGLDYKTRPIATWLAPKLFFFILGLEILGLVTGSQFLLSFWLVLYLSFALWFASFFYNVSSGRFFADIWHADLGVVIASFVFTVEVVGVFLQPFTLTIRLYVNLLFGRYLISRACTFLYKLGGTWFLFLLLPLVLYELAVIVVQAFIFTYLVTRYFREH